MACPITYGGHKKEVNLQWIIVFRAVIGRREATALQVSPEAVKDTERCSDALDADSASADVRMTAGVMDLQ